jgi:hypothetical protein
VQRANDKYCRLGGREGLNSPEVAVRDLLSEIPGVTDEASEFLSVGAGSMGSEEEV